MREQQAAEDQVPGASGELANVLKAIGRFINRAIIDMTDDRPGGGMAARQERDEIPPD